MVKLEEVQDEVYERRGAAAAEDDDEWEGTDDDASDALVSVPLESTPQHRRKWFRRGRGARKRAALGSNGPARLDGHSSVT